MEWLQNILEIDKELFLFLNSLHSPFWDTIMLLLYLPLDTSSPVTIWI